MERIKIDEKFPIFINNRDKNITIDQFLDSISSRREKIEQFLLKHGALVFRGFPVAQASEFAKVITAMGLGQFVNYIGGDSPRHKVFGQVYTSTEAPPSFHIPLHQELSFVKHFPHHIYFYCDIAPDKQGETIIGDVRAIHQALNDDTKQQFYEKGLIYTSHYHYRSKLRDWVTKRSHKSWIDVFETQQKREVEEKCLAHEFEYRWLPKDWLEVTQKRPAFVRHPKTQEMVWFNQAHLYDFNPKFLGWLNYIPSKLFYARKSTRLHEVSFGDGSRIPRKNLYHILEVLEQHTVAFPWQKGDVMVLDNILAMHGRAPFVGPRRILTALTSKSIGHS